MIEKIYFTGGIKTVNDPIWSILRQLQSKINDEIIDKINNQNDNCSPLTCSFNLEITQLFNRIEKLENDMKLYKEHYNKLLGDRG